MDSIKIADAGIEGHLFNACDLRTLAPVFPYIVTRVIGPCSACHRHQDGLVSLNVSNSGCIESHPSPIFLLCCQMHHSVRKGLGDAKLTLTCSKHSHGTGGRTREQGPSSGNQLNSKAVELLWLSTVVGAQFSLCAPTSRSRCRKDSTLY